LLFLVLLASGAGVPAIGTIALGTAAVLASQHELSIDAVIIAGCLGVAVGGVLGRWRSVAGNRGTPVDPLVTSGGA
jgi:membrane protein DedA with SNARE-associated domain